MRVPGLQFCDSILVPGLQFCDSSNTVPVEVIAIDVGYENKKPASEKPKCNFFLYLIQHSDTKNEVYQATQQRSCASSPHDQGTV